MLQQLVLYSSILFLCLKQSMPYQIQWTIQPCNGVFRPCDTMRVPCVFINGGPFEQYFQACYIEDLKTDYPKTITVSKDIDSKCQYMCDFEIYYHFNGTTAKTCAFSYYEYSLQEICSLVPDPSPKPKPSGGLPIGAIIGIAIGAILIFAVVVVLIVLAIKKKQKQKRYAEGYIAQHNEVTAY